ncbi:hypothetical protein BJV74DRAFT_886499 [Russula compacta]|nr:hypothetical protein BJV74DRAFT_886499 [Russula compacta]
MMLSKSLVSVFAALAAVSSVAATATPVRRGGNNGGYSLPPNPPTVKECSGGSPVCCNIFTTAKDAGSLVSGLLGSLQNQNPNVGLTCTSIVGDNQCDTNKLCCQKVEQGESLIGLQCDFFNPNS